MSFDLFNKEHETLEQGMELARQAARVDASLAQQVKGLSDAYGKLLNTTKKSAAPTRYSRPKWTWRLSPAEFSGSMA